MMTVLVIIGLMSSAVILTLPQNKSALDVQSEALLRGINIMAQSSLISGIPSALGLSDQQYAFMTFENGEWGPEETFEFTANLKAELLKNETEIKLSDKLLPLIIFEPNGLSTPFTLTLSDFETQTVLQSSGDGRVIKGTVRGGSS